MRSSSLIEASWAGRRNSEPLRYRRSLKMPDAARIDSCHSLLAPTNTIYLNISVELCMVLGPRGPFEYGRVSIVKNEFGSIIVTCVQSVSASLPYSVCLKA